MRPVLPSDLDAAPPWHLVRGSQGRLRRGEDFPIEGILRDLAAKCAELGVDGAPVDGAPADDVASEAEVRRVRVWVELEFPEATEPPDSLSVMVDIDEDAEQVLGRKAYALVPDVLGAVEGVAGLEWEDREHGIATLLPEARSDLAGVTARMQQAIDRLAGV